MKSHYWFPNRTIATAYDSLCRMEQVPWALIRGDRGKKCGECTSRINPPWRRFARYRNRRVGARRQRNPVPVTKGGFWTEDIPAPHDTKRRLWARRVMGESRAVETAEMVGHGA